MLYFILKCALSGIIVSEVARRSPAFGTLIVSLPRVSLLGMIWLWRDTGDAVRIANHAESTLWYVLPSLPMFRVLPGDAPRRYQFLGQHGRRPRLNHHTVFRHDMVAGEVRDRSVRARQRCPRRR